MIRLNLYIFVDQFYSIFRASFIHRIHLNWIKRILRNPKKGIINYKRTLSRFELLNETRCMSGKLFAHRGERLFADSSTVFPRISNEFQHSVLFIGSCLGAIRLRNPWNDRLAEVNGQLIRRNSVWIALPFLETSHVSFLFKNLLFLYIVSSMI